MGRAFHSSPANHCCSNQRNPRCPSPTAAEYRLAIPSRKFVIASRRDYEWAREQLSGLSNTLLFSPSHDQLPAKDLAQWVLADGLPVRLQLQIHKYIWGAETRGV